MGRGSLRHTRAGSDGPRAATTTMQLRTELTHMPAAMGPCACGPRVRVSGELALSCHLRQSWNQRILAPQFVYGPCSPVADGAGSGGSQYGSHCVVAAWYGGFVCFAGRAMSSAWISRTVVPLPMYRQLSTRYSRPLYALPALPSVRLRHMRARVQMSGPEPKRGAHVRTCGGSMVCGFTKRLFEPHGMRILLCALPREAAAGW